MPKKKQVLPMSNEVWFLIGPPGSGKTTFAKAHIKSDKSFVKVSRDEFRHMFKDEWYPGEEVENLVSDAINGSIKDALANGFNVLVDNTHCNLKSLKQAIELYAPTARIVLKVIGADLSIKEIKAQNLQRDKAVPEAVIDRMYKGYKEVLKNKPDLQRLIDLCQTPQEPISFGKQDPSLPKAIIVDIDGTIAHMEDKRGPFDWHKVDQDAPDIEVLNIVRTLSTFYKVIFVTGRDAAARKPTEAWLGVYFGQDYEKLLTRGSADFRKDNIVKKEIYENHIKGKYYVEAVFDDRDQVVSMWRKELGLKCLQVDYGNF